MGRQTVINSLTAVRVNVFFNISDRMQECIIKFQNSRRKRLTNMTNNGCISKLAVVLRNRRRFDIHGCVLVNVRRVGSYRAVIQTPMVHTLT